MKLDERSKKALKAFSLAKFLESIVKISRFLEIFVERKAFDLESSIMINEVNKDDETIGSFISKGWIEFMIEGGKVSRVWITRKGNSILSLIKRIRQSVNIGEKGRLNQILNKAGMEMDKKMMELTGLTKEEIDSMDIGDIQRKVGATIKPLEYCGRKVVTREELEKRKKRSNDFLEKWK